MEQISNLNIFGICKNGSLEVLKSYLEAMDHTEVKKEVNRLTPEPEEYTPLILACLNNHLDCCKYLLQQGAEVQPTGASHYPLRAACISGNISICELLLNHGANINHPSKGNRTPLQAAVFYNHPDLVKFLLRHGATDEITNDFGERAIDICKSKKLRDIEVLLTTFDASTSRD